MRNTDSNRNFYLDSCRNCNIYINGCGDSDFNRDMCTGWNASGAVRPKR